MKKQYKSLKEIWRNHFEDKMAYMTFRSMFLNNKDKFKNVDIIKLNKRTTYKIYDENNFVDTFNSLIEVERI